MSEHSTSQVLLDQRAMDFAYEADRAFNERQEARESIDALIDRPATRMRPIQLLRRIQLGRLERRLNVAETAFHYYVERTSSLNTNEVTHAEDTIADRNVWNAMKPEQQDRAKALRGIMAERFGQYGVREDSLRVVRTQGEAGPEFVIVHTGAGIDLSSEDHNTGVSFFTVMSPLFDSLFRLTIDDDTYDAREGMTYAAYGAMVADIKSRNGITPDSSRAALEANQYLATYTMITGRPLINDGNVLWADTARYDEDVVYEHRGPDDSDPFVLVRPAIVIK